MRQYSTLALCGLLTTLVAASAAAQGTSVILRLGLNSSTASTDTPSDPTADDLVGSRTGPNIGALLAFGLSPSFAFQVGALYTQKGFSIGLEDTGVPEDISAGLRLTYVEFPFLAAFRIPTNGNVTPYLYAGPAVGVEVGCAVTVEGGGVSASAGCDQGDAGELATKSVDFGAMLGGGLEFAVGSVALLFDVSYDVGFANLDDTEGSEDSVKNRTLTFAAGVAIPLGR